MNSKSIILLILFSIAQFCQSQNFNHDYSQTWVTKMFLSLPDGKGGSEVRLTFEQALDVIRKSDGLSLGVPKIIYLVGWQYNGHDDKYPAFFEVNNYLKRKSDSSALESLRWLMREAKKYNTIVSLHINMTDAYEDSPLWPDYVKNDLISKNKSGELLVIGEYNKRKAYQINYKNEWNKGYTQMRIDRLIEMIPELKEAGTIHSDAWIARASEGHNESQIMEAEYQKKAALYWKAKGLDITSEWVMDYMTGYVPYAWHFNGFSQQDYLSVPANVYTGAGINPDIKSSDFGLGFLFGTSCYGEPIWKLDEGDLWQKKLIRDFMLKCPQYFYLNSLKRLSVEDEGNNRVAHYNNNVSVSLSDSILKQQDRILRSKKTICIPAVWRKDQGVIVYALDKSGEIQFDVPYMWGNLKSANLYRVTAQGLIFVKKIKIAKSKMNVPVELDVPYYLIPDFDKR